MKESLMSKSVTNSLTRKLFNMTLEIGDDVIDLTLGDPDILPPAEIRKAACKAIMEGKTRYSANAGLLDLRKAYAEFFKIQYGFEIQPSNVIATVGGMEGLFLGLSVLVDKDDEVIILGPYYVNYHQMINMCGGRAIVIDRMRNNDDKLLLEIERNITRKTVAIIINSPCNPVGDILSKAVIDGIADMAIKYDISVISDEVYNSLIYDGKQADSILMRDGLKERTLLIDSCSKRFAMTGWRIGFAVGPEKVIKNMTKMQENVAACAPLPSQYAAVRAYSGNFDYSYIRKEYSRRRDLIYDALCRIPELNPIKPEATFYCFVDISATGLDCEWFAYQLLQKKHVAVVPGKAYGEAYNNYIRIAFTVEEDQIKEAMKRLSEFCKENRRLR